METLEKFKFISHKLLNKYKIFGDIKKHYFLGTARRYSFDIFVSKIEIWQ